MELPYKKFAESRIGIISIALPDEGYAQVELKGKDGNRLVSTTIDMYCQYPETSLKFLNPKLKKDSYTLTVEVVGEHWYWTEKSGRKSGSSGNYISVDSITIQD